MNNLKNAQTVLTTDSIINAIVEATLPAEIDNVVNLTPSKAQKNAQPITGAKKGKVTRTSGKSGPVDVAKLLEMPVKFDSEKTVQEFANEIKQASTDLVAGQIDLLKSFSIIGGNFKKIRAQLVDIKKYADSKNPEKSIDLAFGKALTVAGIGTEFINRNLRADYIFLAGNLGKAKTFIAKCQTQYKADLKRVAGKEIKANEMDKPSKLIASKFERVALTPSILVQAMKSAEKGNDVPEPKVDTLAKIVANVQARVGKLDAVTIEQVIAELTKTNV